MADEPKPENVIDMKAQGRLIQEAREARAKREAERKAQYPGGIDDMDLG
ncbi:MULTISPECIES: hypothetical protein [unclassified Bradyrhizobium]|nr:MULTISPECIES: hypothetical protein [unclassified Bradyrhizobium]